VINKYGEWWWLPLAVGLFFFSVILARLVPKVILPIFYKVVPLENEVLKSKIENLAGKAGMKVQNIYSFNMSKNTKKANAAFTGLGKSKRILLGDTLLNSYTDDEIETVIAHELGHYKKKHIIKNLLIGTFTSFFTLYVIAALYNWSLSLFGFSNITQISALPILSLWAMLIGLILSPITNIISRKFEYEADEYAVSSTNKAASFVSVLEKLTEQNLGDKNPHPFVEWFFYSHPSISKRISAINKFAQENGVA
jgi:STE24 endopeptidase